MSSKPGFSGLDRTHSRMSSGHWELLDGDGEGGRIEEGAGNLNG
jgi:hypothetical protein